MNQIMMDINKIQSALQSLEEERTHIEEYLQNAAARKKDIDEKLHADHPKTIGIKKLKYNLI